MSARGFFEDMIGAFNEAAGNTPVIERREEARKHLQQLSDEQRKEAVGLYDKAILGIQERMGTVDPSSPDYAKLQGGLKRAIQTKALLYDPKRSAQAYQELAGFLGQGAPAAADEFPGITKPEDRAKAARIKAGLDPRAVEPKPEAENWVTSDVTYADGTKQTLQHNTKTGEWTDLAGNPIPKERLAAASVAPKTQPKAQFAWSKDARGKTFRVKLDADGHPVKGTEEYGLIPPSNIVNALGKTTTGFYHFVDEKGIVHQIEETRTTRPIGAGGAPGVPKTAGEAKAAAKKTAPAGPKDRVIGFKGNKDYNDTKAAYEAALDRVDTMDKNLKDALATGSQQAMLSLVANHIGMTLGAQRGARITRAVWDEAIQSAPWLQTIYAKAFHEDPDGDMVFDGWKTGVTLTGDQMRQMVQLGHEKVGTLKQHLDRLDKERGAQPSSPGGTTSEDEAIIKALSGVKQ